MDKSWILIKNRIFSKEYRDGVDHFIAKASFHLNEENKTRCPCVKCLNYQFHDLVTVKRHILEYGFSGHYINWNFHGEEDINSSYNFQTVESNVGEDDDDKDDNSEDDMAEALRDAAGPSGGSNNNDTTDLDDYNNTTNLFDQLFAEMQKELYPGCIKFSSLTFIVKLMHIKVLNRWSNKSFDMLLELLSDAFPEGNKIPRNHYEAKRMLRDLGLGYETIHVCRFDCVLYWKEHKDAEQCPVYGFER